MEGVQRQGSVPRIVHVSSLERLVALGSREHSPERRALSAERDTIEEAFQEHPRAQGQILRLGPEESEHEPVRTRMHAMQQNGGSRSSLGAAGGLRQPRNSSTPATASLSSGRAARGGKKEPVGSGGRVVSPRSKRLSVGSRRAPAVEEGTLLVHSPREDRIGHGAPTRTSSVGTLTRGTDREELGTLVALRRELDDSRHENARMQDKLCKARSLVLLLQKQADEARADREKEHRRSEGLQLSAQQLQRQLRRETAKAHQLERTVATLQAQAAAKEEASVAVSNTPEAASSLPLQEEPTPSEPLQSLDESSPIPTACMESVDLDNSAAEGPSNGATQSTATTLLLGDSSGGLDKSWEFVVQGQHDVVQQPDFAPKLVSCFPDDAVERAASRGVAFVCSRGRRNRDVPNQDDFLIARHTLAHDGHIALYGVFDGHGPAGHHCAAFARGSLPESLFGQHTLLMKPEETLRQAFRQTQEALSEQNFDTATSGTTAALALVLNIPSPPPTALPGDPEEPLETVSENRPCETWLFVAHVGDSRVILASHLSDEPSTFSVTPLTRDHRPDDSGEAARIEQEGGEVRKLHRNSGAARVFACGQDRPALALTRSLGATAAADCGVTAVPEISAYQLRPGVDALLLLGTDGLYEFCNHMEAVGKLLSDGASTPVLEKLCEESRQQWAQSSYNKTVDDISAIAVSFPSIG